MGILYDQLAAKSDEQPVTAFESTKGSFPWPD